MFKKGKKASTNSNGSDVVSLSRFNKGNSKTTSADTVGINWGQKKKTPVAQNDLAERLGPDVMKRLTSMANEFVRFEKNTFGFYIDPARYAVKQKQVGPVGRGGTRKVVAGVDAEGNVITAVIGVSNTNQGTKIGEVVTIPRGYELGAKGHGRGKRGKGGPGEAEKGMGKAVLELPREVTINDIAPEDLVDEEGNLLDINTEEGQKKAQEIATARNKANLLAAMAAAKDVGDDGPDGPGVIPMVVPVGGGGGSNNKDKKNPLADDDTAAPDIPTGAMAKKDNKAEGAKKKAFFWTKIPNNQIKGSMWESIDDQTIPIDKNELDELYNAKGTTGMAAKEEEIVRPEVLPGKRKHNVNILLANLKMPVDDILDIVRANKYKELKEDDLVAVGIIVPNLEEEKLLKENFAKRDEVDKTDRFMMDLCAIPDLKTKIECATAVKTFDDNYGTIMSNIAEYSKVPVEIMMSEKYRTILNCILALGNCLNAGTAKGGALGFKIDSLMAPTTLKGSNGETLMEFMVRKLRKENPGTLPFDDIPALVKLATLSLDGIYEDIAKVLGGLTGVSNTASQIPDGDPTLANFKSALDEFQGVAVQKREDMLKAKAELETRLLALAVFVGEKKDVNRGKQEEICNQIKEFKEAVDAAQAKIEEKEEEEAKKRKKGNKSFKAPTKQPKVAVAEPEEAPAAAAAEPEPAPPAVEPAPPADDDVPPPPEE